MIMIDRAKTIDYIAVKYSQPHRSNVGMLPPRRMREAFHVH